MAKTVHSGNDKFIVSEHDDVEIDFGSMYNAEDTPVSNKLKEPSQTPQKFINSVIVNLVFNSDFSSRIQISGLCRFIEMKKDDKGNLIGLEIDCLSMKTIAYKLAANWKANISLETAEIIVDDEKQILKDLKFRLGTLSISSDETELALCKFKFN